MTAFRFYKKLLPGVSLASLLVTCSLLLSCAALAQAGNENNLSTFMMSTERIVPDGSGPDQAMLLDAENSLSDWLYHTHDFAGTRFSLLDEINVGNAGSLSVACLYQIGGDDFFQSGPLVHDGILYITAGARTLALDAADCTLLWEHEWSYLDQVRSTTNRGVAIKDGYVVRGTGDGYLLAIDAADGALIWARQIANSGEGEHFTMAPLIYESRVVIGPAGGAYGISGWVGAFSLENGEPLWRFQTVPGASKEDDETWGNPLGIRIGGGAVWTPLSLDTETGSLFVAVSNPAPDFPAGLRPGDNLYTNSVISLDIHTGTLNWYRQLIPGDDHGWDLTQVSPLFTTETEGGRRAYITSVGKDGILRLLDRKTHEIVYEREVSLQQNTDAPVTTAGTYSCPGELGGVLWNGPALDKGNQQLITPSVNLCSTFYLARETRYIEGVDYFGGTVESDPTTRSGWITALDATTGKAAWRYESDLPVVAAVTTTGGNLVLTGELTGDFVVLNAQNGEELYRFNTGGAIGGGVITYSSNDKQYIAVASGHPTRSLIEGRGGSATLIIFALP